MSALIVGAGFGGIGAAIQLRRAGVRDITILERGDRVGGVWHHNTYPGAACDVPSHLYSYSFAPNPEWGRRFATQPDIQSYVERTAREYGVFDSVRLGVEASAAEWMEGDDLWRVETDGGSFEVDLLVCACGQLTRPQIPAVVGLERFAGPAFHSSEWRHDLDLSGLRVGVLGTGASAIQLVPAIQPLVSELTVVQRSAPWILPKLDKPYSATAHRVFRRFPAAQRAGRFGWWAALEAGIAGFVGHEWVLAPLAAGSRAQLRRQVPDPELRERLTPDYRMGCKRILLSSDWYPALGAPNATVRTDPVSEVTETGLSFAGGDDVDLDVLIFGTGFRTKEFVAPMEVAGRGGRTLAEAWADIPNAWHGLVVPGFPNFFLLYGPNTFGGSGSAIYMLESQMRHVAAAAERMEETGAATIDVRADAHEAFMAELRSRQRNTVWATGGCSSWYVDEHGRDPTNWPGYTFEYRRRTASIEPDVYELSAAAPATKQEAA